LNLTISIGVGGNNDDQCVGFFLFGAFFFGAGFFFYYYFYFYFFPLFSGFGGLTSYLHKTTLPITSANYYSATRAEKTLVKFFNFFYFPACKWNLNKFKHVVTKETSAKVTASPTILFLPSRC
jgi:hypothetical protein